jgi:hypothetical protein
MAVRREICGFTAISIDVVSSMLDGFAIGYFFLAGGSA